MKVSVLTSSRADYSIYKPILNYLEAEEGFDLSVIVFGTHLSEDFGYTIQYIEADGFNISHKVNLLPEGDSPKDIAQVMGEIMAAFSDVWANNDADLIFALGDRYEMFAACSAAVPFGLKIAHIHGGEITKGAIDEVFRHAITLMSSIHFVTTDIYADKVKNLIGSAQGVYNVGALSLDNLRHIPMLSISEFKDRFDIDLSKATILMTFHPETVSFEMNEVYIREVIGALEEVENYQIVVTMPNADTMGRMIREKINAFVDAHAHVIGVESFGTIGYLSCMKHCAFMLGNTSSGFVEAAFFPKYVINLGERQSGRILTPNIVSCPITKEDILNAINDFSSFPLPDKIEVYGDGTASQQIFKILKTAAVE